MNFNKNTAESIKNYLIKSAKEANPYIVTIFLLGFVVQIIAFYRISSTFYTNDLGGHMGYIVYISQHWDDPFGYMGHEKHHPPFYYMFNAAITNLATLIRYNNYVTLYRIFSLFLFTIFICFAIATLNKTIKKRIYFYLASVVVVFWPIGIEMASRINNDVMYYLFYTIAAYYLISWYQNPAISDFNKTLIFAGLALATKSNGIVLFTLIGIIMVIRSRQNNFKFHALKISNYVFLILFLLLCLEINLGNLIRVNFNNATAHFGGTTNNFLNAPYHFLHLNYEDLLHTPFVNWREDSALNFFLKSANFGEFGWNFPMMASCLNFILLILGIYSLAPILFYNRQDFYNTLPYLILLFLPLLSLDIFSIWKGFLQCVDLRFAYPIIIPFTILFIYGIDFYKRREYLILTLMGPILAISYSLLSVIFYIMQTR